MRWISSLLLAFLLTSCTSLGFAERVASAWVLDKIPERQLNDSLTGDEQLEEGEELSEEPAL